MRKNRLDWNVDGWPVWLQVTVFCTAMFVLLALGKTAHEQFTAQRAGRLVFAAIGCYFVIAFTIVSKYSRPKRQRFYWFVLAAENCFQLIAFYHNKPRTDPCPFFFAGEAAGALILLGTWLIRKAQIA